MSQLEKVRFKRSRFLENADFPLQAIHDFLSYEGLLDKLDEMERKEESLKIYWLEDIEEGKEKWTADVLNDELNEWCGTNWVWTVVSQAQFDAEGNDIMDMAPWHISTEEEYSDGAVAGAVSSWLSRHGYDLDVETISVEDAEGSGTLEKLRELSEKDLESKRYVPLEDWESEKEGENE